MEDIIQQFRRDLEGKKMCLIKKALLSKGYGDIVPTAFEKFPKVVCIMEAGNEVYYADNKTPDGDFIIAFYPPEFFMGTDSVTVSLKHTISKLDFV